MRRLLVVLCGISLLAACADLLTPLTTGAFPPNTVQFAPLDSFPQYATWWKEIQTCADVSEPLSAIHFWKVKDRLDFPMPGDPAKVVYGYFVVPMNIVLADYVLETKASVQHEMLHAALYMRFGRKYYTGSDTHPAEFFKQRCGFVAQNPD